MKSIHVARLHKLRVEEFENEVRWDVGGEWVSREGVGGIFGSAVVGGLKPRHNR